MPCSNHHSRGATEPAHPTSPDDAAQSRPMDPCAQETRHLSTTNIPSTVPRSHPIETFEMPSNTVIAAIEHADRKYRGRGASFVHAYVCLLADTAIGPTTVEIDETDVHLERGEVAATQALYRERLRWSADRWETFVKQLLRLRVAVVARRITTAHSRGRTSLVLRILFYGEIRPRGATPRTGRDLEVAYRLARQGDYQGPQWADERHGIRSGCQGSGYPMVPGSETGSGSGGGSGPLQTVQTSQTESREDGELFPGERGEEEERRRTAAREQPSDCAELKAEGEVEKQVDAVIAWAGEQYPRF